MLNEVRDSRLLRLPWANITFGLRARVDLLRRLDGEAWPDFSDEALLSDLEAWLEPVLHGHRSLTEVRPDHLHQAILGRLPWDRHQTLDRLAPERWQAPTGSRLLIDYAAEGGPGVAVRVQELFGLNDHPTIAGGRVPLTLSLLSPAHRPIQVTKDLPGFWRGSWKDVRSEMRGRYPKHDWPEDPSASSPTTRAKPRR